MTRRVSAGSLPRPPESSARSWRHRSRTRDRAFFRITPQRERQRAGRWPPEKLHAHALFARRCASVLSSARPGSHAGREEIMTDSAHAAPPRSPTALAGVRATVEKCCPDSEAVAGSEPVLLQPMAEYDAGGLFWVTSVMFLLPINGGYQSRHRGRRTARRSSRGVDLSGSRTGRRAPPSSLPALS